MDSTKIHSPFILLILVCSILLLGSTLVTATDYIYKIGGKKGDYGNCILTQPKDTTFVITGNTWSYGFGAADMFLMKGKQVKGFPYFHILWSRVIGREYLDGGHCVKVDRWEAYVACGRSFDPDTDDNLVLTRFYQNGNLDYAKTFDVNGTKQMDAAAKIIVDRSNNYVIVGVTKTKNPWGDILVAKFDSLGNNIWTKIIGDPDNFNLGKAIVQDRQGNYVVVGYTGCKKTQDIVIIKLSEKEGQLLGTVKLTPALTAINDQDEPTAIIDYPREEAYVITGYTRSFGPARTRSLLLFKIHYSLSPIIWSKVLVYRGDEVANSLILTPHNRLMVAGHTISPFWLFWLPKSNTDLLFAQFTQTGSLIWAKTTDPALKLSGRDDINGIDWLPNPFAPAQLYDYVATGYTSTRFFHTQDIILAGLGDVTRQCYLQINPKVIDFPFKIKKYEKPQPAQLVEMEPLLVEDKMMDTVLVCPAPARFDAEPIAEALEAQSEQPGQILPDKYQLFANYPNPFNPETTIGYSIAKAGWVQVEIFNTLGQCVRTLVDAEQAAGAHQVVWDARNEVGEMMPGGIYFYKLTTTEFSATRKMLLLK